MIKFHEYEFRINWNILLLIIINLVKILLRIITRPIYLIKERMNCHTSLFSPHRDSAKSTIALANNSYRGRQLVAIQLTVETVHTVNKEMKINSSKNCWRCWRGVIWGIGSRSLSFFSLPCFHAIKCNEDQLSSLSGIKRLKRVHSKRVLNPNERLLKIQILCKTRRETIECRVSWSPFSNFLVLLSEQRLPLFPFFCLPFFSLCLILS